jgi:hypothetical protein
MRSPCVAEKKGTRGPWTGLLNENSSAGVGLSPYELLATEDQRSPTPYRIHTIVSALGCKPELDSETLLLKTSYVLVAEYRKIKLWLN